MEALPDIIFMCVNKKELIDLCDLFPQTADNIIRKAKERRKRFIQQKNINSKRYWKKRGKELLQKDDNDRKGRDEFIGNTNQLMDLDVWVEEQITKENVQMSAILNKYPYVEEN